MEFAKRRHDPVNTSKMAATSEQANRLLQAYIRAQADAQASHLLNVLLAKHAAAIIKKVLQRRLHFYIDCRNSSLVADAEDLYCDIVAELIKRFGELRSSPGSAVVRDFRSYVAGVANNACHNYLRRKNPLRTSLKNKLRYLLSRKAEFALWETEEGEWLCGLSEWREREWDVRSVNLPCMENLVCGEGFPSATALLVSIFRRTGAPCDLDYLVSLVAEVSGIKDQPTAALDADEKVVSTSNPADAFVREDIHIENKFLLQDVWNEICRLPPTQRAALVFNLRDREGGDIITMILETRVTTIRQVAEALNMPADQFLRLWDSMPLDDQTIAAHLGLTRRQVIKLRWSARETLARRLQAPRASAHRQH